MEASVALARAARIGRLTSRQLLAAKPELDSLLDQLDLVDIDDELVRSAAELADAHGLRAYDAVHLAAAARLAADDVVVVAGDRALLTVAHAIGLAVATIA